MAVAVAVAVVSFFLVVALAQDADEGDFGGSAGNLPVTHLFQVVSVKGDDFTFAGVGDEDVSGSGGDMGPGPEAGIDVIA